MQFNSFCMVLPIAVNDTMMILDLILYLFCYFPISYLKCLMNDCCCCSLCSNGIYFVPEQIHGQFALIELFAQSLLVRPSHHSCCQELEQTPGQFSLKELFAQSLWSRDLHCAHVKIPERSDGRMLRSESARGSPSS